MQELITFLLAGYERDMKEAYDLPEVAEFVRVQVSQAANFARYCHSYLELHRPVATVSDGKVVLDFAGKLKVVVTTSPAGVAKRNVVAPALSGVLNDAVAVTGTGEKAPIVDYTRADGTGRPTDKRVGTGARDYTKDTHDPLRG